MDFQEVEKNRAKMETKTKTSNNNRNKRKKYRPTTTRDTPNRRRTKINCGKKDPTKKVLKYKGNRYKGHH